MWHLGKNILIRGKFRKIFNYSGSTEIIAQCNCLRMGGGRRHRSCQIVTCNWGYMLHFPMQLPALRNRLLFNSENFLKKCFWGVECGRCVGLTTYRHLWADCLDNVGSLTSDNPIGLHGLLQGELSLLIGQEFWFRPRRRVRTTTLIPRSHAHDRGSAPGLTLRHSQQTSPYWHLITLAVKFTVGAERRHVGSEVFTAVTMKNSVFWDVAPCWLIIIRRFGGDTFLRNVGL
jgi:hypothetical protein